MTFIHPTATVDEGAQIGEGTKIWHYVHVRGDAVIGKNCIIGKSSYIDTKARIGDNCKIQNFVSVYHGVVIGNNVFVGPHACFTNDLYPRAANSSWEVVDTRVKDGVSIGANATIVCGITIGRCAMVGAGSVVTKDVPPHALVVGSPAKVVGWVCECGSILCKEGEVPQGGASEGDTGGERVLVCRDCDRSVRL